MKKVLMILLPIVIIIGGILGGGYYIYENTINTHAIYNGVTIDDYAVGSRTIAEALKFISEQKEIDNTAKSINLSFEDKSYEISLNDFGYSYNYEKAVNGAYELGRDGNFIERYKDIKDLERRGKNINLEPMYDRDLVLSLVDKIEGDINQEARDATFDFNGGNFNVTAEETGRALKKGDLINLIVDNIYELEDIHIPVEVTEPKVTKDLFSRINGVIGEFSTSFKGSSPGRIQNVKISALAMSNLLLMPGDEISYNESLGPIQAKYGYMEAPVILNGELTPGMGGGVCQTSTTLYNALLLSDVSIVERHPHSIAAAYVPKGTDGAVAQGYLDLKFKNDFDFPIYTDSKVVGNTIHFYIYGDTKTKDYTVKIEPELIATIPYKIQEIYDETVPVGTRVMTQEGRTGYKVKTYKTIIRAGNVVERKLITSDYYRERDFIYKVGPQIPESAEPADTVTFIESLDPIISSDPEDPNVEVIDLLP